MNNLHHKPLSTIFLMVLIGNISACSTVGGLFSGAEEVDYQNSQSIKVLDVPADLTTPNFDKSFTFSKANNVGSTNVDISPPKFNLSEDGANPRIFSNIINTSGRAVLRVNSSYPNALLATEANLKEMGFKISGKTSKSITAKYKESIVLVNETTISNLLKEVVGRDGKRLIKSEAALDKNVTYLVSVSDEANGPIVRFSRKDNKKISDAAHTKIIQLLNDVFNG